MKINLQSTKHEERSQKSSLICIPKWESNICSTKWENDFGEWGRWPAGEKRKGV